MRVLVVLPTYNEIDNITSMLETLRRVVPQADILVVDDGSPDGTGEKAEKLGAELNSITVLHRDKKGGLGSAYRAGFAWGLAEGYDTFVEIDCDFSHDPYVLPALLSLSESHDVVIGSRYIPGGSIPKWSTSRRWLSRGGNIYASFMLGLNVRDSTSGYRVYSARGLELIRFDEVRADGYGFQVEMTYRARQYGAGIVETPIAFTDRTLGQSKMSPRIVKEALWLVTKWSARRAFGRSPLR